MAYSFFFSPLLLTTKFSRQFWLFIKLSINILRIESTLLSIFVCRKKSKIGIERTKKTVKHLVTHNIQIEVFKACDATHEIAKCLKLFVVV